MPEGHFFQNKIKTPHYLKYTQNNVKFDLKNPVLRVNSGLSSLFYYENKFYLYLCAVSEKLYS